MFSESFEERRLKVDVLMESLSLGSSIRGEKAQSLSLAQVSEVKIQKGSYEARDNEGKNRGAQL
jgi:hypothetical protein